MDENTTAIEPRLHQRSGRSCPRSLRVVLVWLAVPLWAASSLADAPIAPGDDYGNGITLNRTSDLVDVVAYPERYRAGPILVKGRISEVCQHKGCWTVLSAGGSNLKVNMRDHAFSIPTDCSGRQAFVEGVLAELAAPDRRRAAAGREWLEQHGTHDVAVKEIAERWEGGL